MSEQEDHPQLREKVVLVTGASRGIGAAAATRLGKSGASVIINYHQNREAAQEVLAEIQGAGGRGMVFQADVTRQDQVELMVQAARKKYRSIDVLVNNAYFPFQVASCTSCRGTTFTAPSSMSFWLFIIAFRLVCRI